MPATLTDDEILGNKKCCTVPLLQKAAQARGLDDGARGAVQRPGQRGGARGSLHVDRRGSFCLTN